MAWLVKSEKDGRGLTITEYIAETSSLPEGKKKIATLYEKLIYLQNIDMIVINICILKSIDVPSLFCISPSEIDLIRDTQQIDLAIIALLHYFHDEPESNDMTRWFKFTKFKFSPNDFIDALINIPADQEYDALIKKLEEMQQKILTWQRLFAEELFFEFDEKDRKGFCYVLHELSGYYYDIKKSMINSLDDVFENRKYNLSLQESETNNDKIPVIIRELVDKGLLIRMGDKFTYATRVNEFFKALDNSDKAKLQKVFRDWVYNTEGNIYKEKAAKQLFKPYYQA